VVRVNDKEYSVERSKLDVKHRESMLQLAKNNLETGKRKLQCDVDSTLAAYKKSSAEMLQQVAVLTQAVQQAEIFLEMEVANLKRCETTLEKGFSET
jgi:hypothetical protein